MRQHIQEGAYELAWNEISMARSIVQEMKEEYDQLIAEQQRRARETARMLRHSTYSGATTFALGLRGNLEKEINGKNFT